MELQFELHTKMGVVCYCENKNLVRHKSEHTSAYVIYYPGNLVTKKHCTAKLNMQ